jgi:hypothetical protein
MQSGAKQAFENEGFRAHDYLSRAGEDLWKYAPTNKLISVLAEEDVSWRIARTKTSIRTITIGSTPKQLTFNFGQQTEVTSLNQSPALTRLEEAANRGSETDFLVNLDNVKWRGRTAAEFVRAIKLAFKAGAFRAALYIASEGVKHHPEDADLRKYVCVLNPNQPPATEQTAEAKPQANREWLKAHAHEYKGKWIAIRNGELLGAAHSLETLVEEVSREYGITFPSREVMVTTGA